MIQYEFYLNKIGIPQFGFKSPFEDLTELGSLNFTLLNEVILSLKKVLEGELNQYSFGYEVYSIDCQKDTSKIIDTFDAWKVIHELPTIEVYKMMRNWLDFKLTIENNNTFT